VGFSLNSLSRSIIFPSWRRHEVEPEIGRAEFQFYPSNLTLMSKKLVTFKVGRDARNGRFLPVDIADRRKSTATVETMKRKR
jgi:hypothetical protein